jgi:hypothetical protein
MNEYLLAMYLWGFLSAVAVAMPAGIELFRYQVQAWERYRGRVAEHVASLTKTPTPVPNHPSRS